MESTTLPYYDLATVLSMSNYYDAEDMVTEYFLHQSMTMFYKVTYSLVFVLGTIGNGLVIFITGFRMKKTVNSIWILNLAIADFTFSFFLPLDLVKNDLEFHWPFDQIKCEFNQTVLFFNLFVSVYVLLVISVDRCISVWCPVWARNHRTPRLASFVALGVWILALFLCSLKLYFTKSFSFLWGKKVHCIQLDDYQTPREDSNLYVWDSIRFVFGFIIPFIVIVVCYGAIGVRLRRDQLSHSSKPFKVITAVIVAFFVCWFPLHFFFMFQAYRPELRKTLMIALPLTSSLAFFNSCLNPILYFCMGYNFKEKLRCSLFSALGNAFTEESNHRTTKMKARSSGEVEAYGL